MLNFIQKNNAFWDKSKEKSGGGNLLTEEIEHPFVLHLLSGCAVILNRAKGFSPLYVMKKQKYPTEFYTSYVSTAKVVSPPHQSIFSALHTDFTAMIFYLQILFGKKRIIDIKYKNILIGDIVYDMYLTLFSQGTISKPDMKVYKVLRKCIRQIKKIHTLIKLHDIKACLFSHRIGISSGISLRAALADGIEVYTCSGENGIINISRSTEQGKFYEYTPTKEEIDNIKALPDEKFNRLYEKVYESQMGGLVSMDAINAFNPNDPVYTDRQHFAQDYHLDPTKKNIFVLLHAFNDHPHTHFNGMIFEDYADWFLKTLEYAKKDNSVNWIFKRHPSDRFYPANDIDFDKLFADCPSNVILIDGRNKINSRSLHYVADVNLTCSGSAGFEIAAMAKIPCITAGDNPYIRFDFSYPARDKDDYFKKLSQIKSLPKLSDEQQKTAKAFYIFTYYLATVPFEIHPVLSFEEQKNFNNEKRYMEKILDLYTENEQKIQSETDDYAERIAKDDFIVLRTRL